MSAPELVLSGNIWSPSGFKPGRLTLREGRIAGVDFGETTGAVDYDFGPAYITPGLIDMQLNGGLGLDFTVQPDAVDVMAEALPQWGVTAFIPTFITAPIETYHQALGYLRDRQTDKPGALVIGAHLEGP